MAIICIGMNGGAGKKKEAVQENTPSLSTNQRVLYPRATFVYLLRYPFNVGGPSIRLSVMRVVSLLATATNCQYKKKEGCTVLTLTQKYAHLVIFADDLLYGTTFAIPNEDVCPSAY